MHLKIVINLLLSLKNAFWILLDKTVILWPWGQVFPLFSCWYHWNNPFFDRGVKASVYLLSWHRDHSGGDVMGIKMLNPVGTRRQGNVKPTSTTSCRCWCDVALTSSRCTDVDATLHKCHDIISTLIRCCINVVCLQGSCAFRSFSRTPRQNSRPMKLHTHIRHYAPRPLPSTITELDLLLSLGWTMFSLCLALFFEHRLALFFLTPPAVAT